MATLSSILAWEIPWTEEPGGLQSMELQRVRRDLATKQQHVLFYMWKNSSCPPDLSKTLYERVNSRHMWGQLLMQEETYTTSSSLRSWVPRSSFPALSSLSRLAPSHFASFTFFFYFMTLQYCIGFAIYQNASMPPLLSSAHILSHVRLCATPWTVAHKAPLSVEFSRQGY